jgi:hypothetical protein
MWLKRSFRLPLPASPSSTNEVETVHPQVVGAARISPDPLLSGKEAFPLFSYLHSLQPIKSARNSPQNCSTSLQFLVESARNSREAGRTRRCFSPREREKLPRSYFYSPRFFAERARAISLPASRSFNDSRLSCAFFPRARANSTFTFPLLK